MRNERQSHDITENVFRKEAIDFNNITSPIGTSSFIVFSATSEA